MCSKTLHSKCNRRAGFFVGEDSIPARPCVASTNAAKSLEQVNWLFLTSCHIASYDSRPLVQDLQRLFCLPAPAHSALLCSDPAAERWIAKFLNASARSFAKGVPEGDGAILHRSRNSDFCGTRPEDRTMNFGELRRTRAVGLPLPLITHFPSFGSRAGGYRTRTA